MGSKTLKMNSPLQSAGPPLVAIRQHGAFRQTAPPSGCPHRVRSGGGRPEVVLTVAAAAAAAAARSAPGWCQRGVQAAAKTRRPWETRRRLEAVTLFSLFFSLFRGDKM